ncbi:MAG: hypothetical protein ACWGNV_11300 [Bacteroidales bacterium]
MAFSRITRIILYVVAGISLLVILFYYVSPKTIDYDALEMRVEEATNPADMTPVAPLPTVDSTAVDSMAVDSTASAAMAASTPQGPAGITVVEETQEANLGEIMSGWEYLVWFRTDIALIWAYILVVLTLIAAIVFPLIAVFSNPKALIRLVAILAGAAVLVIISYLLSSDKPIDIIGYTGTDNSDPGTLKMIDTVLFVTYMLFGIAIASILYAIVSKAFK